MRRSRIEWLLLSLGASGVLFAAPPDPPCAVLHVVAGGRAASAGIEAGDRIARYDELALPGLSALILAEDARTRVAAVRLELLRGERRVEITLPPGARGWELGPAIPPELFDAAAPLIAAARAGQAVESNAIETVGQDLVAHGGPDARWWWFGAIAGSWQQVQRDDLAIPWLERVERESAGTAPWARRAAFGLAWGHGRRGDVERAAAALERARLAAEQSEPPACLVEILLSFVELDTVRQDLGRASDWAQEAVRLAGSVAPESLLFAAALHAQAVVAMRRGDYRSATGPANASLALRERLDRGGAEHARALSLVGSVEVLRGMLDQAVERHRQALAIRAELDPGGIDHARALLELGQSVSERAELFEARALWQQALEILERLGVESLDRAWALNNLGACAASLQDLPAARRYHLAALAIRERLFPASSSVAISLYNLALVQLDQGDVAGARADLEAALEIVERIAPENLETSGVRDVLGVIARLDGDLPRALALHEQALAVRSRELPGSQWEIETRVNIGWAELDAGRSARAAAQFETALEMQLKIAPNSAALVFPYDGLAAAELARGALPAARRAAEAAERTLMARFPGHPHLATVLYRKGLIARAEGNLPAARDAFETALERLDRQRMSSAGALSRFYFSGHASALQHATIDAALAAGDLDAALGALERSRARGVLEVMIESGVDWLAAVPPELRQRVERLRLERQRLIGVEAAQPAAATRWVRLEHEQEVLLDAVRDAVPGLLALVYPQPLDAAGIAAAVEPGTVVLAYSFDDTTGLVLALHRDQSGALQRRGERLPFGGKELARRVSLLRGLLGDPASGEAWRAPAAALGEGLLTPVADWLDDARRLVLIPDGALHRLPFGVLAFGDGPPLVERTSIEVAPSLTILATLERRTGRGERWVGFGDPEYDVPADGAARGAAGPHRAALPALPGTRQELVQVEAQLAGARRLYLGAMATESAALREAARADVAHFACHGLLDDRFPLRSGLALSASRADPLEDGVLHGYEILERLRTQAELVVLSGCDTGGGQVIGGEGLLGLSRAFLGAGARSLLVSHWGIADRSTAVLIERFYRGLSEGLDRDAALQQAQRSVRREPGTEHPYHWAAFELIGSRAPLRLPRRTQIGMGPLWGFALAAALALVLARTAGGRSAFNAQSH